MGVTKVIVVTSGAEALIARVHSAPQVLVCESYLREIAPAP